MLPYLQLTFVATYVISLKVYHKTYRCENHPCKMGLVSMACQEWFALWSRKQMRESKFSSIEYSGGQLRFCGE